MINTDKWNKYKNIELFECENTGNVLARDINDGSGTTPYVTASAFNNGVYAYIDASKYSIIKGNCILIGGKTFTVTYQKDDFVSNDSHNFTIRIKDKNLNLEELHYLYLVTVIYNYFGQKYSWNDAVTKDKFLAESIPLPTTSINTIDWDFMKKFMNEIVKEAGNNIATINSINTKKKYIDIKNWQEFKITTLFDMYLPKGDLQVKKVHEGLIPLITPSNYNNGVFINISENSKSTLFEENTITVDMFGNAYYQDKPYFVTAHGHVNVLKPKFKINQYIGMFIATSIRQMFLDKYDFKEMCTQKILNNETIKLPVLDNQTPDWHYMENYMKTIMKQSETVVDNLTSI